MPASNQISSPRSRSTPKPATLLLANNVTKSKLVSPSLTVDFSGGLLSPHVRFPTTPKRTAVFETYSKKDYDRKPRLVSPTSFAWAKMKPGRGMPISPSTVKKSVDEHTTESDSEEEPVVKQRSVRFAVPPPLSPLPGRRTPAELDRALAFLPYPRSPFPASPSEDPRSPRPDESKPDPKLKTYLRVSKTSASPRKPLVPRIVVRRPPGLDLTPVTRFAPPGLTPITESPSHPAILQAGYASDTSQEDSEDTKLSNAFWNSVCVEEEGSPDPVVQAEGLSPSPLYVFGRPEETLWSPTPSRRRKPRQSPMMTPITPKFQAMRSPALEDPMSLFPSFATSMQSIVVDGGVDSC